jgi:hypothetical protein
MRSIVRHASQFSAKIEGKKTLNDTGWLVVCCPSPMLPDLAAGWGAAISYSARPQTISPVVVQIWPQLWRLQKILFNVKRKS